MVQRVQFASVKVDGETVGKCGAGLLVLVAAHRNDTEANAAKLADRVWGMRIFNDENGKMNLALKDAETPQALVVSQFTLYGDTSQRRPSFTESAPYADGERLYESFVDSLCKLGCAVEKGKFGADMKVELLNDGPVTLIADA